MSTETAYDDALDELGAALAEMSFDSLDEETIAATRQRIFDTLGATAIGLETPEGHALKTSLPTPAGNGVPRSAAELIGLYVGATRTTEIDDIDIASCTTAGAVVVPVALAIANAENRDDRRLIAAVVAGYEAMLRIGRAIGGATILYRGVWPTYVTASLGAAATTAHLLGLDGEATANALALAAAATSVPPASAFADPAARYQALGLTAIGGAAAAYAAAAGTDAGLDAFERYGQRLSVRIDVAEVVRPDGARWLIREVDTKLFPTSRQALASIEAFVSLAPELPDPPEIERIIVHVPSTYRDMVDRPSLPSQRIESMIGVQYAMALALVHPGVLYDVVRAELPQEQQIVDLIRKIEVRASPQLDTLFPRTWGSTVTVHRASGQLMTQEVLEPSGSRSHELDWRKLGRKVARVYAVGGLANAQFVNLLLARCRGLATNDAMRSAGELLGLIKDAHGWATERNSG